MLRLFKRTRFHDDKIATIFVDHFLSTIENGFPEVAALVNESPEFVTNPGVEGHDSDKFLLIALAANIASVQRNFSSHKDNQLSDKILRLIADVTGTDYSALCQSVTKNQNFISKVNHPSKNLIYGMSKAFFYKYGLNKFQDEYFRNVNSPNPIFIKRLDDVMACFMWNWEETANS